MDGKTPIQVKTFRCPQCANTLTARGMNQTQSIVCGSCGSIVDISDENLKILDAFISKVKHTPLIPLGTKGALRGEKWEAIGFMRRCITVEGIGYRWSEYLLFNPYKGFRWLTEYNGHWNYVRQIVDQPRIRAGAMMYGNSAFKHFQQATAVVEYVMGEFYWRVQVKDSCLVNDYVSPPLMLSSEQTQDEVTWSLGEYIAPEEIQQAFQLKSALNRPVGIYANQPSPYAGLTRKVGLGALLFVAIALTIQILAVALAQNKMVHNQNFRFEPAAVERSVVSEMFVLDGRTSNVVLESGASVSNSWIFINMALINDDTGTAYEVGREIAYYTGSDSDGPWTEGSRSDSVTIPGVPSGRYYLRAEPEGDAAADYSIRVYRDVPSWGNFLAVIAVLLVVALFVFIRSHVFESKRWAESDHPWTSSGEEEED
jgi:hypothetical protein